MKRRSTYRAHRHHVDADPIEIALFIAGSLLASVLLAAIILSMAWGYMR